MNWDILGHEWAVDLFRAQVARDDVRHAYLFCGPAGVGRRTLALRLAQALNCLEPAPDGAPCRNCRICRQIEAQQHPDLFVVQAEKEGGTLRVDQIRELQHNLSLHPYEAHYRIALLLRFEEAHISAMNALLKTLEEPAERVKLLLTADNPENLLPTIVSRCELIRLRPLAIDRVQNGLIEAAGMDSEQARLVAHCSAGRPGIAIRLANDPELLEARAEWLEDLIRLMGVGIVDRFNFVDGLTRDRDKDKARQKLRDLLQVWLSFWRDVLLVASGVSTPVTNLNYLHTVQEVARSVSLPDAVRMTKSVERSVRLMEQNVNLRLIAEVLVLDLPRLHLPIPTT